MRENLSASATAILQHMRLALGLDPQVVAGPIMTPVSSLAGLEQFLDKTWASFGQYRDELFFLKIPSLYLVFLH